MTMKCFSGQLDQFLVPATVVVSDGRIISMRPNAETARVRVWQDVDKPSAIVIANEDTPPTSPAA